MKTEITIPREILESAALAVFFASIYCNAESNKQGYVILEKEIRKLLAEK